MVRLLVGLSLVLCVSTACSGSGELDRDAVVRDCQAKGGVISSNCGAVVDSLVASASAAKLKCSTNDLKAVLDDFESIASSSGQPQDVQALLRSHCH